MPAWLIGLDARHASRHRKAMDTTDFDPAIALRLKAVVADSFPALLENFLSALPNYFDEMTTALDAGDCRHAQQTAHKLVTIAGQFGLKKLSALARELEYADQDNPAALRDLLTQMRTEYTLHLPDLHALLAAV